MTKLIENQMIQNVRVPANAATLTGLVVRRCDVGACMIAVDATQDERPTIQHCTIQDSKVREAAVGPVVISHCTVADVTSKALFLYGSVLREVIFTGNCGVVTLLPVYAPGNPMAPRGADALRRLREANRALELDSQWTFDVRGANFKMFEAYGVAIERIRADESDLVVDGRERLEQIISLSPTNSLAFLIKSRIEATGPTPELRAGSVVLSCRGDRRAIEELREIRALLASKIH